MKTMYVPANPFLSGTERFVCGKADAGFSISDYWSWAFSDLYNNVYRGDMAEFIVASALGLTPPAGQYFRNVWNPYDLLTKSGTRVEVKSAAYLQSWDGDFSKITFGIAPAHDYPVPGSFRPCGTLQRNNDVYVFCLFTALVRSVPMYDLDAWEFRVLRTSVLDELMPIQKRISLTSLDRLRPVKVGYSELPAAVEHV